MRRADVVALASRIVAVLALLTVAGALPWLSQRDPAASILRARYAELEPTPEALAAIRAELGLDGGPLTIGARWWSGVLRGDLGASWVSGGPVGPGAAAAFGVSLTLAGFALVVAGVAPLALIVPAGRPARGGRRAPAPPPRARAPNPAPGVLRPRRALPLVAVLVLTACGAAKSPAQRLADCLNARSFLVQANGARVEGSSPGGVNFTVSATGRIDDTGNPGRRRLAPADRRSIHSCLD